MASFASSDSAAEGAARLPMRWTAEEMDLLDQVRERLREKFLRSAPYPEVIGDRKLIRFIRGHGHNLDKVCEMVEKFLDWRFEVGADDIRKDIFENNLSTAQFPGADIVLSHVKFMNFQAPPHPEGEDGDSAFLSSFPLVVEPHTTPDLFDKIDVEAYIKFRIYMMEYISMAIEQISHEKEQLKLRRLPAGQQPEDGYGHIEKIQFVRCLKDLSMFHISVQNQAIGRRILLMSSDNYPETVQKVFVINAPWVFNSIFSMIKMILPATTLAKIDLVGSYYTEVLDANIGTSRLPDFLGGPVEDYNAPFAFDRSEAGPLAPVDVVVLLAGDPNLELEGPIHAVDKPADA